MKKERKGQKERGEDENENKIKPKNYKKTKKY